MGGGRGEQWDCWSSVFFFFSLLFLLWSRSFVCVCHRYNPPLLSPFFLVSLASSMSVFVASSSLIALSSSSSSTGKAGFVASTLTLTPPDPSHSVSFSVPFCFVSPRPASGLRRIDPLIPISFFISSLLIESNRRNTRIYSSFNLGLLWPLICLFLPPVFSTFLVLVLSPRPNVGHFIVVICVPALPSSLLLSLSRFLDSLILRSPLASALFSTVCRLVLLYNT